MKYQAGKERNRKEIGTWQAMKFISFNPWLLTNNGAGSSQGFMIKVVPTPPLFLFKGTAYVFAFLCSDFIFTRGKQGSSPGNEVVKSR